MQYLFMVQTLATGFLIICFYKLKKAKKRLLATEKKTRCFATAILEHEEKVRLKFTNALREIINMNKGPNDKHGRLPNTFFKELSYFTNELAPYNRSVDTLITAVEKFIATSKQKNLKIIFSSETNSTTISSAIEIIVYRVIKEGINNAKKHSLANRLYISLYCNQSLVELSIEDNGTGFDINQPTTGLGLLSITKAISFLNGKIEIQSTRNKGTLLSAIIPVNP